MSDFTFSMMVITLTYAWLGMFVAGGWMIGRAIYNAKYRYDYAEKSVAKWDDLPKETKKQINKECSQRFWSPVKTYFKWLLILVVVYILSIVIS